MFRVVKSMGVCLYKQFPHNLYVSLHVPLLLSTEEQPEP
jgi:hypothetical protein